MNIPLPVIDWCRPILHFFEMSGSIHGSLRRSPPSAHAQVQQPMARVSPAISTKIRRHCLLLAGLSMFFVTGCSPQQGGDIFTQMREGQPQEFLQTSVDRMATLTMRDNLD